MFFCPSPIPSHVHAKPIRVQTEGISLSKGFSVRLISPFERNLQGPSSDIEALEVSPLEAIQIRLRL